jgi:hypothetical protein
LNNTVSTEIVKLQGKKNIFRIIGTIQTFQEVLIKVFVKLWRMLYLENFLVDCNWQGIGRFSAYRRSNNDFKNL